MTPLQYVLYILGWFLKVVEYVRRIASCQSKDMFFAFIFSTIHKLGKDLPKQIVQIYFQIAFCAAQRIFLA